jgi:general stress protein 26
MANKISNIKKEVLSIFKDYQTVFLATAKDNQPRVRPVTLMYFDKKFWVLTGTTTAKVKQIQKNPKIEFCLFLPKKDGNGYIRLVGKAKIVRDKKTKVRTAENCGFFNKYWKGFDDPEYTLIEIHPREIEYLRQGDFQAQRIKL